MRKSRIEWFTKGWFVGNFEPSLYKTNDVEVAYKYYNAGDRDVEHFHKIATEMSLVTKGVVRIKGENFVKGDIIIIDPGDVSDFSVVEDAEMVVIKIPGANNDKYEVEE